MGRRDEITALLREVSLPLDDDDIGHRLGIDRHYVNQICRHLEHEGLTTRAEGPDGKLRNLWRGAVTSSDEPRRSVSRARMSRPPVGRSTLGSGLPGSAAETIATVLSGQVFEPHGRVGPDIAHPRRIGLVGCVKQKARAPLPARDLYISELFRGRRAYVERSCNEWWILSAKHGLVHPEDVLAPYDETLKDASTVARRCWSREVFAALVEHVTPVLGESFEIHAGAEYRDYGLVEGLRGRGYGVQIPTEGMAIGVQLRFYKQARALGSYDR
jgi:hypothetical protein